MEKEVLKRYFEQTSTDIEKNTVEDWLLDPSNKITFENFLVEEWQEHVQAKEFSYRIVRRKSKIRLLWKAASIAALLLLTYGGHQLLSTHQTPQPILTKKQVASVKEPVPTASSLATTPTFVSDTARNFHPKTVQHEKKKERHQSKALIAQADTTNQQIKQASVQASVLTKAKINEAGIARLIQKIDSNQLVFDVNVSEAAFQQLAYIFRKEYGIILELCSNGDADKTYTAKFKKISFHDLLDDMSEKMAFTYSFQDNKVKICFN